MICLCSKFFFQYLALPKDPQSFGSQNLRCPFLVSQYYRCRRLCISAFAFLYSIDTNNCFDFFTGMTMLIENRMTCKEMLWLEPTCLFQG